MRHKISIIVPTLNEEKLLPALLDSISGQEIPDGYAVEIVIADAGSQDATRSIAASRGCIVVEGGLPARGKNKGASHATGDIFLFIDADSVFSDAFLKRSVKEFMARKLAIASFFLDPGSSRMGFFFNVFYNYPIRLLERILPHGAMGILITREAWEATGGFDESVTLAEDHDFVRRARRFGTFGLIQSAKLHMSVRRFQKDGWVLTYVKYIFCDLHMIFLGPVRSDVFSYRFNHYSDTRK